MESNIYLNFYIIMNNVSSLSIIHKLRYKNKTRNLNKEKNKQIAIFFYKICTKLTKLPTEKLVERRFCK